MSVAVLPFNSGPNARPTLARQFSNFASEVVRVRTDSNVHAVNYLMRVNEENPPQFANVNPAEVLNEPELVAQLFQQTDASHAMDGLFEEEDGKMKLTMRVFERNIEEPVRSEVFNFDESSVFATMRSLIAEVAKMVGKDLPAEVNDDMELFGTSSQSGFLSFLEGFDALQYVEKTQGQVITQFDPQFAYDALINSVEKDKDWEAPFATLIQLARASMQLRIGSWEQVETVLRKATELEPEDVRSYIVLGELYQGIGNHAEAKVTLEKALELDPNEPALYTRLGIIAQESGDVATAEAHYKKAIETEGEDKPTVGFLSNLLMQAERGSEVPPLWKGIIDANPKNSHAWANYASSLMATGESAAALRAFDDGVEKSEESVIVKRAYAPALASLQEFDKAMDLYEDCLDVAPTDIQLLLEYAQTLQAAERSFEVPKVLRDVLGANPDGNTRAQTLAWLVELEQAKRVEAVANAKEKMDAGDFEGAVKLLRPMRHWLADYWKMWALYASALNRMQDFREGEDAARKLIELFPGNEIGFVEYGNALMGQDRAEEAYNALRYGLGTIQNSLGIAIQLGLAARRTGKDQEAKELAAQIRAGIEIPEDLEPIIKEIEGSATTV